MVTYDTLWQKILEHIQTTDSVGVYKTWFSRTSFIQGSDEELLIGCPNTMVLSQIERKYRKMLDKTAKDIFGKSIELRFIVQQIPDKELSSPLFDELPNSEVEAALATSAQDAPIKSGFGGGDDRSHTQLNANYTFEQFVVGGSNRVAHAAALAITDNPGQTYNPLFIYGGTGVGKTHLVQAIGNELLRRKPRPKILYFPIEKFVNEFIESMRFSKMNEFKKQYRTADMLIVDDIQFIAGKEGTQEEFFHTFNELHASGRQIIICSDRPPREIASLADRLTSRFEGGLMVDINPPDFETRSAIIRAKAAKLDVSLPPEVADFIASLAPDNIRALEGTMLKLKSLSLSSSEPLNLTAVQNLFQSSPAVRSKPKQLNPNQILKVICETYSVTLKDLTGKSRTKNLVVPRQLAMYILRNDSSLNLESIGHLLGGRDHTTVMHGIDKVAKLAEVDDQTRTAISAIRQSLR